ncbi:MAG: MmgE/PrpD family protein [Deltaproteobacteria bacterium]|nr:MmgE/PrpD family protein [Deltaproteobacteria bacterium]
MNDNAAIAAIEALSNNVIETRFEDIDGKTVDMTKRRIMDVLGCSIGGACAAGNNELIKLVKDWGGKEEASIIVHGGKVPAHNAAMLNSIMARSFDFEALAPMVDGREHAAHISGTTVMTAITLGEMMEIDGKELISALVAGENVAIRVLVAGSFSFSEGWCDTGTINMIGATAIAGRLLGLNNRQMRHAFGIVLSQLAGSLQNVWDSTTAFKLPQGLSARNGIFSAQLAKAGWTGPDDMLLGRFGYYHLYTEGCENPEILTRDLGEVYFTEGVFKPYPCCRANHAAIDCALAILEKNDVRADDIQEVALYLSKLARDIFIAQPFRIGEFPHGNAAFNCQYTLASTLLRGKVMPEHFSEEAIRDPKIKSLTERIRIEELPPGAPFLSARVEVKMKDGRKFSEYTDTPWGDQLYNIMSDEEIKEKFWANVNFCGKISRDNAAEVLELIDNIEELDSVKQMVDLVVH